MKTRKRISQRAALRMRKELRELRARLHDLKHASYPGTLVSTIALTVKENAEVRTAAKLGHLLVVRPHNGGAQEGLVFAIDNASLG